MKITRLYTNKPGIFAPVDFAEGLNAVVAEIRLPENRKKDTHNLGKTTLGRLLDFCLLSGKDNRFFLFKHIELFGGFVFFLEMELPDYTYLTIRRSVEAATKISFKKHGDIHQDFSELSGAQWDHFEMPFDRAKEMLDGLLDWRGLKPWSYRKGLGYQLRSQDDYRDVFQLRRFQSAHADWKPFLAHLLGFNAALIASHYEKESELVDAESKEKAVQNELGGSIEDVSKIDGMLLLKQDETDRKQKLVDAFDFRAEDKEKTKKLVDEIDQEIAALNERRYSLSQSRKKITESLKEDRILFDPASAEKVFEQAGVLFSGQIKKDFEQLIAFNKAITEERRGYLQEERTEIDSELRTVNASLEKLGEKRSQKLAYLSDTDIFNKYKSTTDELVALRADITTLNRQKGFLTRLQELRGDIRGLKEECGRIQEQVEADVEAQNADKKSLFSSIRLSFNEIVEEVIDRKALLNVSVNKLGHIEFSAEILDEADKATSADLGHTYRKLLCIAFDLSVLRAHLNDKFPRFVFHDGVFESLDDRKKENLLRVIGRYSEFGIQPIVTAIDSDLPARSGDALPVFNANEVVLTLHDEGDEGRLFKMPPW